MSPIRSSRAALACLAITMLLSSLGTSIANVALPTFIDVFHANFRAVQWVALAYLLAVTTLIVSVGRLGDLLGRRRLMVAGIALFTVASIVCGAATSLWMLIVGRVGQGLGAAVMMALSMALLSDAVPKQRAGRAMGFLGTMSAVGTALGPSLGGLLISAFGWRAIFFVSVPLALVALLLAWRALPLDAARERVPSFDLLGSTLLALTLGAYALSMTLGREAFGMGTVVLLVAALIGAGLFLFAQSRIATPLVRLSLFRDRVVGIGFTMSALVTTVAMTTLVVGPFYLARSLGLAPASVGLVMTAGPVVAAFTGLPAGRAVDRFGAHVVAITGVAAMVIGCAALATLPVTSGIAGYAVSLAATTAGYATFQAANNTAVLAGVESAQRGVVSGLLSLSRNLGLITGASAMGAVFAAGTHAPDISIASASAIASGTHAAFAVAAALVVAALALAVAVPKAHPASLAEGVTAVFLPPKSAIVRGVRKVPESPTNKGPNTSAPVRYSPAQSGADVGNEVGSSSAPDPFHDPFDQPTDGPRAADAHPTRPLQ